MEERTISSLEDMSSFACDVLEKLVPHESGATVLALTGDLGAGKTAFVKALAAGLEIESTVTSPTFVIMKSYDIDERDHTVFRKLVHVDAYRLGSSHELMVLGWAHILADPTNIIALEWPERVPEAVPSDAIELLFEYVNETTRKVRI